MADRPQLVKGREKALETVHKKLAEKKATFVKLLKEEKGVWTYAAERMGVERSLIYHWRKNDPEFAAAIADVKEVALDYAERSLFRQMDESIPAATIFYLKTQGKHRGYGDTQTINHNVSTIDAKEAALEFLRLARGEGLSIDDAIRALEVTNIEAIPDSVKADVISDLKQLTS